MQLNCALSASPYVFGHNLNSLRRPSELRAVLGTGLHSFGNALGIQCSADNMVTHTRKILNTSTTNQHNTMLLQVVAHTRNIRAYLNSVRKPDSGDFS